MTVTMVAKSIIELKQNPSLVPLTNPPNPWPMNNNIKAKPTLETNTKTETIHLTQGEPQQVMSVRPAENLLALAAVNVR